MQSEYIWTDNPTVSGVSKYDTDVLNDCLMHLKYNNNKGTAGHYIGELIYSPIPILNELGVTPSELHFTDGGVVSSAEYEGFASRLDAVAALYPELSKTEAEWQAVKAQYGEVNAFVIDKAAGTIRLPLIVNPIKGAGDLSQLGAIVEAGLPNIEGSWFPHRAYSPKGCVKLGTETMRDSSGATFDVTLNRYEIDASLSNPIYGKSDTVQPQQPFGCIYIVLAGGMIQDYTALEEFAPVEAHSLLESKYSESILYNPAWLRSEGQWNAKGAYPSVFNALLAEHNANLEAGAAVDFGYTKRGLAVKLSTEEYTDFDFVINTADETFRLPLRNGMEGMLIKTAPVLGPYKTSSSEDGLSHLGNLYQVYSSNVSVQIPYLTQSFPTNNNQLYSGADGLYADLDAASIPENYHLYYYVGNTVKNAQLIDAGRALERISDVASRVHIVETYQNGSSWYRVWSDGFIEQAGEHQGFGYGANGTVTLLKDFKTTDYYVNATQWTNGGYGLTNYVRSKTISNFTVQADAGNTAGTSSPFYWYACGY